MRKQLVAACTGSFIFCFLFLSTVTLAQSQVQACLGSLVSLEVTDLPQHNDTRQWQVSTNGTNYSDIAGATGLSYTFTATAAEHNKYYRLRFTNSGGNHATYNVFRIAVQQPPAAPAVTHGTRSGVGPVELSASAPAGYTYRWYAVQAGGVPFDGATSATFTTPELTVTTTYYVAAVSPAGCEGARAAVTATITGVNNITLTNSGLISNNQSAMPLDPLQPIAPETMADVETFRITNVPDRVQGKLYVAGTEVMHGQELAPAQVGQLTFTPDPTFYGTATFAYTTIHKNGVTNASTVIYQIPVNAAPLARNVSSNMISSGTSANLLPYPLNAIDFDGNIVRYTLVTVPTSGFLYAQATGGVALRAGDVVTTNQLYYNPNQNGKSQVQRNFTYTATDDKGVTSNTATYLLHIEIVPVNSAPISESKFIPAVSNAANVQVPLPPLTASDPDGYVTSFILNDISPAGAGKLFLHGNNLTGRTQHITQTGMLSGLTFEPNPNFSGDAQFTFTAIDNADATSAPATYTIPVTSPPTAHNVEFTVRTDNPNAQQLSSLRASDPDGTIATYTILSLPRGTMGSLLLNGQPVTTGQVLSPQEAAALYFQKTAEYDAPASFTYTATDNYGIQAQRPGHYELVPDRVLPLPVTLVSFVATSQPEGARLTWATAMELQNDHFTIEKSIDGKNFEAIGQVKGAGNSALKINYSFTDNAFTQTIAYYRLKQTDFDGTSKYSKTITLKNQHYTTGLVVQAYPNPVQNTLTIRIATPAAQVIQLHLLNLQGAQLKHQVVKAEAGINYLALPTSGLVSGVYMVRVTTPDDTFTIKVVKE